MDQSATENQFHDCVLMKLNSIPVPSEAQLFNASDSPIKITDQVDLKLTIRFGDQEIPVLGGHVRFGLKFGVLRLKLENSKLLMETMGLTGTFETSVEVDIQSTRGVQAEASFSTTIGGKIGSNSQENYRIKYKDYQVKARGTEEEPLWIFEAKGNPILCGQLTEEALGRLVFARKGYKVQATFEVRGQRDIYLTEADGLWSKNISKNKFALLEREFFLRFIATKLKPYISRIEVQYE